MISTTRELAERLSGADEIVLVWQPETERVELSVVDLTTGTGFRLGLAPEDALDAFYHPYAYAATRGCVAGPEVRPC